MFKSTAEQIAYIQANFAKVTDKRFGERHWDIECAHCKVVRGFDVITQNFVQQRFRGKEGQEPILPYVYLLRCPVCGGMLHWIIYRITEDQDDVEDPPPEYYRVISLPATGSQEIEELPADPPELRAAYSQAIRAMDANAPIAAAAMFRRALQVITRNILGATPGNLAGELRQVVGRQHNGTTVRSDFSDVAYIIKEAGNQGAHPDEDPDLLDFTEQDARDLQSIFLQMAGELFVVPAATKKAREDFMQRRKISPPPSR